MCFPTKHRPDGSNIYIIYIYCIDHSCLCSERQIYEFRPGTPSHLGMVLHFEYEQVYICDIGSAMGRGILKRSDVATNFVLPVVGINSIFNSDCKLADQGVLL